MVPEIHLSYPGYYILNIEFCIIFKEVVSMNPIAKQLNQAIEKGNPYLMEMMSDVGKKLFFPKGILSQGAEAKEKAHKINATIGIATERGRTMRFDSVMAAINDIRPEESLTYAPSFGIPALRKKWHESLFEKNSSLSGKTISLPVVTCGITHGISVFADVWVDPGDVVILPDMMWGNYSMILDVRKGAKISKYSVFTENGELFFIDFGLTESDIGIEEKAMDLHLFKRVISSTHGKFYPYLYDQFILGYSKAEISDRNEIQDIISRINQIELRGRYNIERNKESKK